jgi:hypothetical protein
MAISYDKSRGGTEGGVHSRSALTYDQDPKKRFKKRREADMNYIRNGAQLVV